MECPFVNDHRRICGKWILNECLRRFDFANGKMTARKNRSRHLLLWKYEFKIDMWGDLFIIQVLAEGICIADIV